MEAFRNCGNGGRFSRSIPGEAAIRRREERNMNTKGNQRAVETENRIKYVFLNLLKEKDISRISVSEICKRAEIHRTTFYVHYKDVADLMEHLALSRPDISFKLVVPAGNRPVCGRGEGNASGGIPPSV